MPTTFETLTSSKSDEYYTPEEIIIAARKLMGGIDLDPATSLLAQQWIKAQVFYRKHQNGMEKPWFGRLWLNPPYSRKNLAKQIYGAGAWFEKAWAEYCMGNVTQAVCLGRGDSDGLRLLMNECYFVDCSRIPFIDEYGNIRDRPVPGSKLFYLGKNTDDFIDLFRPFGLILRAV